MTCIARGSPYRGSPEAGAEWQTLISLRAMRSERVECGSIKRFLPFRLENPVDRGAWKATVHGVAKSQT